VSPAPNKAPGRASSPAKPAPVDAEPEDALIERARIALARSRFDEAFSLLAQHEKRFPAGSLRSQRELLIVRALLGTSNRAQAIDRAERLRLANPSDPSLPAIDALLAK
jgi:outer membrane protein assembly factor BamD (BamD/ComL family)